MHVHPVRPSVRNAHHPPWANGMNRSRTVGNETRTETRGDICLIRPTGDAAPPALTWVAKRDEAAGCLAEPFGVYLSALYQFLSDGARWTLRVEHVSRRPLK
jgi:hypothetical protein